MKVWHRDEHVTLYQGDCVDVMRDLPDASVDAVVTDPPYGIRFMGEAWDGKDIVDRQARGKETSPMPDAMGGPNGGYRSLAAEAGRYSRSLKDARAFEAWSSVWAAECHRLLKPGGHLLAFGSPRLYHRLVSGIENAGFEIRDTIAWLFGQGFPKSLDVAKAVGKKSPERSEEFQTWRGWGTALKPAFEPCVVARKPLSGSVAENVLAHGVGALDIDACRIHTEGSEAREYVVKRFKTGSELVKTKGNWRPDDGDEYVGKSSDGRWPTNVALDGQAADEVDRQSGLTDSSQPGVVRRGATTGRGLGYGSTSTVSEVEVGYGDSGGASRFFPTFRYAPKASAAERPKVGGVQHPTVKPLELMKWLVRLVAPQGATILDPFAGSGTTVEACIGEGMRCIAIEREEQYLPLIVERMSKPIDVPLPWGDLS